MSSKGRWFASFVPVVLVVLMLPSAASAGLTYFLVAEREGAKTHGDSFVVGIEKASDVAHARDLVARGPDEAGAPILFADVAKGNPGNLNRNLTAPGQPAWSWHVTNVTGFGDFGIELLDGWPTFVENDVDGWVENTNGKIGFWSYTVVRELPGYPGNAPPAVPLPPGALAGGLVMAGVGLWRWRAARARAAE